MRRRTLEEPKKGVRRLRELEGTLSLKEEPAISAHTLFEAIYDEDLSSAVTDLLGSGTRKEQEKGSSHQKVNQLC